MQHRRRKLPILLILLVALAGGTVFLLLAKVPAPTVPVEEKLPAGAFLKKES